MKIKNVKVYGLSEAISRSGLPMLTGEPIDFPDDFELHEVVNLDNDITRAKKLAKVPSGSGHDNWLKGIIVQFDLQYPIYWSPQFQRYNFPDIISSQSRMHKITSYKDVSEGYGKFVLKNFMTDRLNWLIEVYNSEKGFDYPVTVDEVTINDKIDLFTTIVSSLPSGFELWMGVNLNYLSLKTIYHQRKNHKLKHDWGYFCNWIETLPMSELITGKE